jgi:hypothetical protein
VGSFAELKETMKTIHFLPRIDQQTTIDREYWKAAYVSETV